jgi:transposase
VGIDVSKAKLDVTVLGDKRASRDTNDRKGFSSLITRMRQLNPAVIVVEATGGYEEAVVLALF